MEKSSSYDELIVRRQFDRLCKVILQTELLDYIKHITYRKKHEVLFSELSQKEQNELYVMDEHNMENQRFRVLGYDIEVKDTLIAEALKTLTERKRNVILLAYFLEMSDAEIAREMSLVRSTVHEHRKRSLELLRKRMEKSTDESE